MGHDEYSDYVMPPSPDETIERSFDFFLDNLRGSTILVNVKFHCQNRQSSVKKFGCWVSRPKDPRQTKLLNSRSTQIKKKAIRLIAYRRTADLIDHEKLTVAKFVKKAAGKWGDGKCEER